MTGREGQSSISLAELSLCSDLPLSCLPRARPQSSPSWPSDRVKCWTGELVPCPVTLRHAPVTHLINPLFKIGWHTHPDSGICSCLVWLLWILVELFGAEHIESNTAKRMLFLTSYSKQALGVYQLEGSVFKYNMVSGQSSPSCYSSPS
ncbi:unnamed protein product [Leuciscus chuanchicus]